MRRSGHAVAQLFARSTAQRAALASAAVAQHAQRRRRRNARSTPADNVMLLCRWRRRGGQAAGKRGWPQQSACKPAGRKHCRLIRRHHSLEACGRRQSCRMCAMLGPRVMQLALLKSK